MIIYFNADCGCGLRETQDFDKGLKDLLSEVGTMHNLKKIREATQEDINWVSSMGGYVPDSVKETL